MKSQDLPSKEKAEEKLQKIGQSHLLKFWESLSMEEKKMLSAQIENLDINFFHKQKLTLHSEFEKNLSFEPLENFYISGNKTNELKGKALTAEGKAACLVLAGGQGSRLRFEGPKGCYPISVFKKKSLYQLIAEKIRSASILANRDLLTAIMTSPLNHAETENFFIQHDYFGLKPGQISFFTQDMWPLLDFQENLFLQTPSQIAMGPNGNGECFFKLFKSGIFEKWEQAGVEMINIISVDNPLAVPFDFELFGFHSANKCSVTFKTSLRKNSSEKVGILVRDGKSTKVIEYSEIERQPIGPAAANLGLYCVSMSFVKKAAACQLPLHVAKKAVQRLDSFKETVFSKVPNAWKFERFIFDAFSVADKIEALLYPRENCFAPLKNLEGEDSIDVVKAALLALDRKIYTQVTGVSVPQDAKFELAPEFYYPTDSMLQQWQGKSLPQQDYIEAT